MESFRFVVNQDNDCVCVSRGSRLAVFSTPAHAAPRLKSHIAVGPAGPAAPGNEVHAPAMLHKSNILAFVVGAKRKKLRVYDDLKSRTVCELDFEYPIARTVLRRDAIVTLTTHALCVYSLAPAPSKLFELPLAASTLLAVSSSRAARFVVATETQQRGHLQILDLTPTLVGRAVPSQGILIVKAHDSTVRAIAVSPDGSLVASASDRGTLIRIWDAATGAQWRELRRGVDTAAIHAITFSADGTRLVVVSDKATVHVFHVGAAGMPASPTTSGGGGAGWTGLSPTSPSVSAAAGGAARAGGGRPSLDRSSSSSSGSSSVATTVAAAAAQRPVSPSSSSTSSSYVTSPAVGVGAGPPRSTTSNPAGLSTTLAPGPGAGTNTRSHLAFLTPLLPAYFGSEWSFSSCKIPLTDDPSRPPPTVPPLLAWQVADSDKVMVTCADGRVWRFAFDRRRGGDGILDGVWRLAWGDGEGEVPVMEDL
ncbi:Phosphatidylinositol 3,5-bisphosphate-binding protein [Blastocladiella emersonii ATCC 22665]|nr:Phosphatidylinositol 3,5-bisphosphate-binding protein [Blastocladiella emersonii ATCC 22665]